MRFAPRGGDGVNIELQRFESPSLQSELRWVDMVGFSDSVAVLYLADIRFYI